MARTTPPRPIDVATVFPELGPLARQAVRLHPRPGRPTIHESSVGGPLLWPADEDWPACSDEHGHWDRPVSLEDIRRYRDLLEAAWLRPRSPGENLLTAEQRAHMDKLREGHPPHHEPNPLLPVAQLYLRDIPGLSGPEGADVLQILWCPLDHAEGIPAARLFWRDSADVREVLARPPVPLDVDHYGNYVPEPCVLHPEVVTEYPASHELPDELGRRLSAWGRNAWAGLHPEDDGHHGSTYYQNEHSVAPGWKVGGWGPWSFRDPSPMNCGTCGSERWPLLTVDSGEWDGGSGSWIPLEDRDHTGPVGIRHPSNPPMVQIGRGYTLQIYICPTSFDHPHLENMQ
ncbi:hypothetical protein [Streptomyces sp. NPDC001380]|uniref:hypothetical protein n=1 Tax=Streptomyces sp. NPDC001380 TaxID=3364566 RepID=UPI0036C851FD